EIARVEHGDLAEELAGAGVVDLDHRGGASAEADDQFGSDAAVQDVGHRQVDPGAEVGGADLDLADQVEVVAVEDADHGRTASAQRGEDLRLAVAVDVGGGDVDAIVHARREGQELGHQRSRRRQHAHHRLRSGAGPDDDARVTHQSVDGEVGRVG